MVNSTSKLSRPSKSLSILLKNSSTSSLDVGIPLLLRTLCHSSGVSLPSPFLSARVNIFRIWKTKYLHLKAKWKEHYLKAQSMNIWRQVPKKYFVFDLSAQWCSYREDSPQKMMMMLSILDSFIFLDKRFHTSWQFTTDFDMEICLQRFLPQFFFLLVPLLFLLISLENEPFCILQREPDLHKNILSPHLTVIKNNFPLHLHC